MAARYRCESGEQTNWTVFERLFDLSLYDTTPLREVVVGTAAFLTMAYINFVNPAIMADAGMDRDAAFVPTCRSAAIDSLLIGLLANYPFAIAPGMGLNAIVDA